jgi:hypothetical protein
MGEAGKYPPPERVAQDFSMMAAAGINTVRTYTVPTPNLLDEAARNGLMVMIGVPWAQHLAFLDDVFLTETDQARGCRPRPRARQPSRALMFALGNEIPPAIVRWHGRARVERFLRDLFEEAKTASPSSLPHVRELPPTEILDTRCFDICAFNVYLHREADLRAYLARAAALAGTSRCCSPKRAPTAFARDGGQAADIGTQLSAAFAEGACGAVAFSWTDEWWRGGHDVTTGPLAWSIGPTPKPVPRRGGVSRGRLQRRRKRARGPGSRWSVCAYNAADTIDDCLTALERLNYPDVESSSSTTAPGSRPAIARGCGPVHVIDVPNGGLSAARNVGLEPRHR